MRLGLGFGRMNGVAKRVGGPLGLRLLLREREALSSADSEREGAESKWKQVYFLCGYVSKRHAESWSNLRLKPLALVPKVGGGSSSPKPGSGRRPSSLITVG